MQNSFYRGRCLQKYRRLLNPWGECSYRDWILCRDYKIDVILYDDDTYHNKMRSSNYSRSDSEIEQWRVQNVAKIEIYVSRKLGGAGLNADNIAEITHGLCMYKKYITISEKCNSSNPISNDDITYVKKIRKKCKKTAKKMQKK